MNEHQRIKEKCLITLEGFVNHAQIRKLSPSKAFVSYANKLQITTEDLTQRLFVALVTEQGINKFFK